MSMETITVNTEQTVPEDQPIEQPVKRRRGRPPKVVSDATATVGDSSEPKTRRGRRSNKLTASDVEMIVGHAFDLYVLISGRPYWHVEKAEIEPWSDQAAKLLNNIPAKYITAVSDSAGYFVVGVGLYRVVAPRIAMDAKVNQEIRNQRTRPTRPTTTQPPEQSNPDVSPNGVEMSETDKLFAEA